MTRLRQGKGPQLRLLPAAAMPRAPLEKDLVDAVMDVGRKMGFDVINGRIYIFNHKPPFLPIMGPGTPDTLFVNNRRQICGIESKRDRGSKERESQLLWQARHPWIPVAVVRSVEEAVAFLKANRDVAK